MQGVIYSGRSIARNWRRTGCQLNPDRACRSRGVFFGGTSCAAGPLEKRDEIGFRFFSIRRRSQILGKLRHERGANAAVEQAKHLDGAGELARDGGDNLAWLDGAGSFTGRSLTRTLPAMQAAVAMLRLCRGAPTTAICPCGPLRRLPLWLCLIQADLSWQRAVGTPPLPATQNGSFSLWGSG